MKRKDERERESRESWDESGVKSEINTDKSWRCGRLHSSPPPTSSHFCFLVSFLWGTDKIPYSTGNTLQYASTHLWFHVSEAVDSESSLLIADVKVVHLVLANIFCRHSAYLLIPGWNANNMKPPHVADRIACRFLIDDTNLAATV